MNNQSKIVFGFVNLDILFDSFKENKDFLNIISSYKDDENYSIYNVLITFEQKRKKLYNCMRNEFYNKTFKKENFENLIKSFVSTSNFYCEKIFSRNIIDIFDFYLLVLSIVIHINTFILILFYRTCLYDVEFYFHIDKYYEQFKETVDFGFDIQDFYNKFINYYGENNNILCRLFALNILDEYRNNFCNIIDF